MTRINVFGKTGCAKCDTTKRKIHHFLSRWDMDHKVEMIFHDLDTVDGRAEGAFHDVLEIPATLVEADGRLVARWDGQVPNSKAVRLVLEEGANVAAY